MSHCCGTDHLFENNQKWVEKINQQHPDFFKELASQHQPEYLWIGCSDARMPANELVGLAPGEVFVHRNIANLVNSSDMNVLAVIEYAVRVLKVKHIIVNGHYGCGGVTASISDEEKPQLIEHWIRPLKKYFMRAQNEMSQLSPKQQIDRLCEINVVEQVRNICHVPAVRKAWQNGQELSVHGFIYDIQDGKLHNLNVSISDLESAEDFVLRKVKVESIDRGTA